MEEEKKVAGGKGRVCFSMDLDRGRLDNHSSIYSNIDNTVKFLFLKTSVVKFEAWK